MTARLPSQLPDEAVFVDGANDWTIVQPSGKSRLYRVRPLAAVPNLPASKITSGTLDAARIPSLAASKITSGTLDAARIPSLAASIIASGTLDLARLPNVCTEIGSDVETASGSLSGTFAGQLSITASSVTSSTLLLILCQFTGYAYRASGTGQFGIELRLRRGTSTILVDSIYPCYGAGGYSSGDLALGGTAFIPYLETISSNQTYYLDAKYISGSSSADRVSARMNILRIR